MIRLLLTLLLLSGPALADSMTYKNDRFGTSAQLPMQLSPSSAPENGDGYRFKQENLDGFVLVFGSHNPTDGSFADYKEFLSSYYPNITYAAGKRGWFVLSGIQDDAIYYLRVEGCDRGPMHHIYFEFPKEEKPIWAPIIETYARLLDGPCG